MDNQTNTTNQPIIKTPINSEPPIPETPIVPPQPESEMASSEPVESTPMPESDLQPESVLPPQPKMEITPEPEVQPQSTEQQLQDLGIATPPKTGGGFLKGLFIIALIIFIFVVVALGLVYFKSQKNSSTTDDLSSKTSPTPFAGNCFLNDRNYQIGESFITADGCNTCTCVSQDEITCTEKACATPTTATKSATTSTDFNILKRVPQGKEIGDESNENLTKGPLKAISITFNKSADPKTITNETFYVLEGIGAKTDGKISYDNTTKTATITFTSPVSKIDENIVGLTVVIKGIKDISNNLIKETTYNIRIN